MTDIKISDRTKKNKKFSWNAFDFSMILMITSTLVLFDYNIIAILAQFLCVLFVIFVIVDKKRKLPIVLYWNLFFCIFSLSSIMWANNTETILSSALSILQVGVISTSIVVYVIDQEKLNIVLNSVVLSATLLSIRFFISVPYQLWGQQARFDKDTIFGSNTAAMVLSYAAIIIFWKLREHISNKSLYGYSMILLFNFVAVMTGTKKGLAIVFLGFVIITLFKSNNWLKIGTNLLKIIIGATIMIYLVMEIPVIYGAIGYRLEGFLQSFLGGDTDVSTRMRILFMERATDVFLENPFFGIGLDGFRYVNYYGFTYAHNNYLELLADVGIVGTIAYYSYPVKLLYCTIRGRFYDKMNALPVAFICTYFILDFGIVTYSDELTFIILAIINSFFVLRKTKTEN